MSKILPFEKEPSQPAPEGVDPKAWALLQQAGAKAAERLLEMLDGASWARLKAGDKARLVELALNRAYGPPIKREQRLELRGNVSDAVSDSLAKLSAADLPEMRAARRAAERHAERDPALSATHAPDDPNDALSGQHSSAQPYSGRGAKRFRQPPPDGTTDD